MASRPVKSAPRTNVVKSQTAELIPLASLELDSVNPRFGGLGAQSASQTDILDRIVTTFGISDVISSLAVNGYFKAEPLVGRRGAAGKVTIVEGNRRLAACLVLANDDRAKNQQKVGEQSRQLWVARGSPSIDPVPVIIFQQGTDDREILSYLGVRHISASAPWDSYAKAAWVASVVEGNALSVSDVAQMVGDKHQTVSRLLEGYYFMMQVEREGYFHSQNSQKSGRGSVTAYPFSWVYTILGYLSARNYLGLAEGGPRPNPVPSDKLKQAGILCRAMFGDRSRGLSSAVGDSRELGDLAAILPDPNKVALLEAGNSISSIIRKTRPIDERLQKNLVDIRALQTELLSGLTEQIVELEVATKHLPAASASRRQASAIEKALAEKLVPPDVD